MNLNSREANPSDIWIFHSKVFSSGYISKYFASMGGCLLVYLYQINLKTAEPIGPKFCYCLTLYKEKMLKVEIKKHEEL